MAICRIEEGFRADELIAARLIEAEKLVGFRFSDSKHGNDDPDGGSIDPFRLFLVYHQPVNGEAAGRPVSRLPP